MQLRVRSAPSLFSFHSARDWGKSINFLDHRFERAEVADVHWVENDSHSFVLAKVVKKYDGNNFKIRTSQPGVEVHWLVTARRHDPTSEYMPLEVERRKVGAEDGRYLVPGAYGKDDSFGMARSTIMSAEEQREAAKAKKTGVVRGPMGRG